MNVEHLLEKLSKRGMSEATEVGSVVFRKGQVSQNYSSNYPDSWQNIA